MPEEQVDTLGQQSPSTQVGDRRLDWKPHPWLAAVLCVVTAPLGMLYVQRPWLAAGYFLAAILLGVAPFLAMWAFGSELLAAVFSLGGWIISIVCAVHAFRIARAFSVAAERKWYSRWYGLACFPLLLVVGMFVARSFAYEAFRIPSDSMYPTIPAGSIVFVKKAGFGHYGTFGIQLWRGEPTEAIARGDLVIHQLATDPSVNYIRRVVAIPGDHIRYVDRQLVINGRAIPVRAVREDDHYRYAVERIDGRDVTLAFIPERPTVDFDQVVPPGKYVMFGDSRDNARDSRHVGLIPEEDIVGRVVIVLPPLQARGE